MADYFNYGMNEPAWKNYAMKQRRTRAEESAEKNPFAVSPFKAREDGADQACRLSGEGTSQRRGSSLRQSSRRL